MPCALTGQIHTAVTGTSVGGIPEIVQHNLSALLVPPANPQAMGRAILDMLQHPNKAASMAQKARKAVSRFALENMIAKTKKIYESLL